jgi:hypothetical protein
LQVLIESFNGFGQGYAFYQFSVDDAQKKPVVSTTTGFCFVQQKPLDSAFVQVLFNSTAERHLKIREPTTNCRLFLCFARGQNIVERVCGGFCCRAERVTVCVDERGGLRMTCPRL